MRIALASILRGRQTARTVRLLTVAAARVAAVALLVARPVGAQATRARTPASDSLLTEALATAALGDTNRANDLLERASRLAKRDPQVLYWRGLLLARSTNLRFGDVPRNVVASRLLERAAELDPKNPRYLLEIGRIRLSTPLLRLDAERMFNKALRLAEESGQPEQVADIAWELGQIKERRYQTTKDRYLLIDEAHSFKPNEAINQKHYTSEFLAQHARPIEDIGSVDRSEAEELYRRALRALPTHEASAVGVLALLYDQQRYQEMREVVRPFVERNAGSARLWFAAGLAAYRSGAFADAEGLLADALARMPASDRADAAGLARIIRRRDAESYERLSAAERLQTDSAYWEAADPSLSTTVNEGRLEFLARVALADLRFSSADTRQVGWKTDRGLVLVRYGEPPVVALFAPQGAREAADAAGRVITVWFYPREERTYVFSGPPAMNYASFAGNMRGYAEENRENAPFLLDNVPFAVAVDSMPIQVGQFRGANAQSSQIVVATSLDLARLYRSGELDRSQLELSLRAGVPSRLRVAGLDTLPVQLPGSARSVRRWVHPAPPGSYRVRVEAQDVAVAGAAGRAQVDLTVRPTVVNAFEVSDVLLTERPEDPTRTPSGVHDATLRPLGSLTIDQRQPFGVYWESYGARATAEGRVQLDVKIVVTLLEVDRSGDQNVARALGAIADAIGLTKEGEQQLGVQFRRDEPLSGRDRVPLQTTLGLGTSPAGMYRLELIVTDRVSGAVSRTERTFHIARN